MIRIISKLSPKYSDLHVKVIYTLMQFLNFQLGAKTVLNYKIMELDANSEYIAIRIPIQYHTIADSSFRELLTKRVETVKTFISTYDWNKVNVFYKWCWRYLTRNKFDLFDMTRIRYGNIVDEPIDYNITIEEKTKIYEIKLEDGTIIRNIVDPFVLDYGLYINLSVPFKDMNYAWNSLHLYEHMMTYAWKNLSEKHRSDMNGGTMIHGLCYIYNIHSTLESLLDHFDNYLKFHLKTRTKEGWNDLKDGIETEIERTISETIDERSLTNMGRSDTYAFTKGYDTEIFRYYSNKPFTVLLITPVKINVKKYVKDLDFKTKDEIKLQKRVYNYIPISVLRDIHDRGFIISKNISMEKRKTSAIGLDCIAYSEDNDLSGLNMMLINVLMSDDKKDLNEMMLKYSLPCTNAGISNMTLEPDASFYFNGINI